MSAVAFTPTADWMLALPEDEFEAIVARDARGVAEPELAEALRHPRVQSRWLAMLRKLLADLQAQYSASRGDPDYDEWRHRAKHFQHFILVRRAEARRLLTQARQLTPEQRAASLEKQRQRGEIGKVATQRLIEAHAEEFRVILREEHQRAGLDVPKGLR